MRYTKSELIEKSKVYFNNNKIDKIKCTTDGNFFYTPEGDADANNHLRGDKSLELHTIELKDINLKLFVKPVISEEKEVIEDIPSEKKITKKQKSSKTKK